jgi:preprotein translocase subunit YajC
MSAQNGGGRCVGSATQACGESTQRRGLHDSMQGLIAVYAFQTSGGAFMWLPLVFIFAVFYFLLILPQQRRQKKWQKMLGELKTGDRVVTSGGLRGTIVALRDDFIHLRVPPDNIRVEVQRASIVSVTPAEGGEMVTSK